MNEKRGDSIGAKPSSATVDISIGVTVNGVPWQPSGGTGPGPVVDGGATPPSGGPGLALVAAARVGPAGSVKQPAFGELEVVRQASGLYRLAFPHYDPGRLYLVIGTAIAEEDGEPRMLERVAGPGLDDELGLYVRTRSLSGMAVDCAFAVLVHELVP